MRTDPVLDLPLTNRHCVRAIIAGAAAGLESHQRSWGTSPRADNSEPGLADSTCFRTLFAVSRLARTYQIGPRGEQKKTVEVLDGAEQFLSSLDSTES